MVRWMMGRGMGMGMGGMMLRRLRVPISTTTAKMR
jgi:hypothetical protein